MIFEMLASELFKEACETEINNLNLENQKPKSSHSFSELLGRQFSQSVYIKIGCVIERGLSRLLEAKGLKITAAKEDCPAQLDILFELDKTVYYFELKLNVNLDTEKCKATNEKIDKVKEYLERKYKDVQAGILCMRYPESQCYSFVKKELKYRPWGYLDFFKLIGEEMDQKSFEDFIRRDFTEILYNKLNSSNSKNCPKIECNKFNSDLPPMFKWSGGKRDELSVIMKYIPPFDCYFEPFVGGASVLFALKPPKAVIGDSHHEVIAFYKQIQKGAGDQLFEDLSKIPNDEKSYYEMRASKCSTEYEVARKFFYLRKTAYRGMLRYNQSGEFNIPFGRYKTYDIEILRRAAYREVLSKANIVLGDFAKTISQAGERDFIFLDPPYDCEFTTYGPSGSFTANDHIRLALMLRHTTAKWLMIISETALIKMLYDDFIIAKYPKKYKFKLHSGRIGDEECQHLVIGNVKEQRQSTDNEQERVPREAELHSLKLGALQDIARSFPRNIKAFGGWSGKTKVELINWIMRREGLN